MGLLIGLLTLPVSGPIRGTIWVAEQVRAAAERSWFDEAAIRREIDDEEHEEAADALIDRLLEAAAARERGVDLADEEDEADVVEVDEVAAGEEDGDA